jgi:UDP-N-acetylmuramate--alanine ligase
MTSQAGPLLGRKMWIAGIGGAGMSAYAVIARAWGAEVSGWDRAETPYLGAVRGAGIEVEIAPEPTPPAPGYERYVSTAFATRIEGQPRADLLAELVSLRPSIVVTGAHGKTTTTGMIAFCLDRLGLDPAFIVGGEIAQLGGNARAGSGWLVVEGDESDRSVAALRPEIAVLLNVDLDHHTTYASLAEVERLLEDWLAQVPKVVRAEGLEPVDLPLALPGEHNRRNAAAALTALELAGVERPQAERVIVDYLGAGRRFEKRGEVAGVRVYDDYGHHPTEVAVTLETARAEAGDGRLGVLFQPHLYSRTRHLAREFARALAAADAVCVAEIYPAREDPVAGVSGKLIVDALSEIRPGMPIAWAPKLEDGARFLEGWAKPGDLVLTIGAGDVDRAGPMLLEALG